jgi:hypothetical protein
MPYLPADSARVSRMEILPLHDILRTTIEESENLIVQVQSIRIDLEPAAQVVACLRIKLVVRVEVVVARW